MKRFTIRRLMTTIAILACLFAFASRNVRISTSGTYRGIWVWIGNNRMLCVYVIDREYFETEYEIIYWRNVDLFPCEIPFAWHYDRVRHLVTQHYRPAPE